MPLKFLSPLNLKWKFIAVVVLVTLVVSGVQTLVFYRVDQNTGTDSLKSRVSTLAAVLANNSSSAVQFRDRTDALEVLGSLSKEESVRSAFLYTSDGQLLADYVAPGEAPLPPVNVELRAKTRQTDDHIIVTQPVTLGGQTIGVLYVSADFRELEARQAYRLVVWPLVLAGGLLLALLSTLLAQRFIVAPILELARVTQQVRDEQDYSMRARKNSDDELGSLVDSFNSMLEVIQRRDAELESSRDLLEIRVSERTEALTRSNEDLERQSQELEVRQEELRQSNEELEAQRNALEDEKEKLKALTTELELSQSALEHKAHEAELASRYKSEFLANISHELRTPLNSIMILSQILAENPDGNLGADDIKNAETVHASGRDLLVLINDILDLSKIEAGKLDVNIAETTIADIVETLERTFSRPMQEKGLEFSVTVLPDLPSSFPTDRIRCEQVLKNLVSNAMKFTDQGCVSVEFSRVDNDGGAPSLRIDVTDTGIGIPKSHHASVFEAFRQVDSSLSRSHGGTGLGLSISQRITRMLGGRILLESSEGKGSRFTVQLPLELVDRAGAPERPMPGPTLPCRPSPAGGISDDRDDLEPDDRVVLVIEDDRNFAGLLLEKCANSGLKCLHAANGPQGLEMARQYRPQAIVLDLRLPGTHGIAVLDQLKGDPRTRHIPVHVISAEDLGAEVLDLGAVGYVAKPVPLGELDRIVTDIERITARETKNLLLIEDDPAQCDAIRALFEDRTVKLNVANSIDEASELLREHHYDCVILDPVVGGEDAVGWLEAQNDDQQGEWPPVVIYAGSDVDAAKVRRVGNCPDAIVIHGEDSHERLLDEVTLFLHSVEARYGTGAGQPAATSYGCDDVFAGRKALIVDDDIRNIYSLRQVLLSRGLEVTQAHNGKEALDALDADDGIHIVLMDIMMPQMNGFDAIEAIRRDPRHEALPIIALTAKAMKQDREDCLRAGASDYLSKPIDIEKLLSLMRVWLSQ